MARKRKNKLTFKYIKKRKAFIEKYNFYILYFTEYVYETLPISSTLTLINITHIY